MTATQPRKRRQTPGKTGHTRVQGVRDEALGHATPKQTAEVYATVAGDHPARVQWLEAMECATGLPAAVLVKHSPDAGGHCKAEKCRGALWPCPPAASVIADLS